MNILQFFSLALVALTGTEAALTWVKGSFDKIPENAIFAGYETSSKDIEVFVGR